MLLITASKRQYLKKELEEKASLDFFFFHTFIKKDLSALSLYWSFPCTVKISLQPKPYLMNCCNPFSSLILELFLRFYPTNWFLFMINNSFFSIKIKHGKSILQGTSTNHQVQSLAITGSDLSIHSDTSNHLIFHSFSPTGSCSRTVLIWGLKYSS